jgi:hypothetical protein
MGVFYQADEVKGYSKAQFEESLAKQQAAARGPRSTYIRAVTS